MHPTLTSPFAGAIARPAESSCLKFALTLLPYHLPFLLLALASLLARPHHPKGWQITSQITCALGLAGWFTGAFLSLGYALG